DRLLVTLDARRSQLARLLDAELPGITWHPPQAGYLGWLDCTVLGDGAVPQQFFLDKARVALEPGPRFGAPGTGYVRLNFATSSTILGDAVIAMAGAVNGAGAPGNHAP
ncbi:MAG: cystathionine beta-lyase, partial [Mycobacterium sp.]